MYDNHRQANTQAAHCEESDSLIVESYGWAAYRVVLDSELPICCIKPPISAIVNQGAQVPAESITPFLISSSVAVLETPRML